jgi:RimJ/RimL family protein N-acetyltransferase
MRSLYDFLSDWEIAKMLAAPTWPYEYQFAVAWCERQQSLQPEDGRDVFMLAAKHAPGSAIGCVSLDLRGGPTRHLGFWLARSHWGQGLMTEALHEVLRFGFIQLDLSTIVSGCLHENAPSRRIHEKTRLRDYGRRAHLLHAARRRSFRHRFRAHARTMAGAVGAEARAKQRLNYHTCATLLLRTGPMRRAMR